MTDFIREKERSRHILFSPKAPHKTGEFSETWEEERTKHPLPRDNWSGLYCFIRRKKNPPSQPASSKLCTDIFQRKVTLPNVNLKDNYFCLLFWTLSSGIWFKTWVPKKKTVSIGFFSLNPTVTLNALSFLKKNPTHHTEIPSLPRSTNVFSASVILRHCAG